jgi:hypothetical protein
MTAEEPRVPTTVRLAQALREANAPASMIEMAEAGVYDDFKSEVPTPILGLIYDLKQAGLHDLAGRAQNGEFDSQRWEGDEWMASPEGVATTAMFGSPEFRQLFGSPPSPIARPATRYRQPRHKR